MNVSCFCLVLQSRLHEENERCLLYLDGSTRKALVATAEKQLLDRHTSAILDKVKLLQFQQGDYLLIFKSKQSIFYAMKLWGIATPRGWRALNVLHVRHIYAVEFLDLK